MLKLILWIIGTFLCDTGSGYVIFFLSKSTDLKNLNVDQGLKSNTDP